MHHIKSAASVSRSDGRGFLTLGRADEVISGGFVKVHAENNSLQNIKTGFSVPRQVFVGSLRRFRQNTPIKNKMIWFIVTHRISVTVFSVRLAAFIRNPVS